MQLAGVDVYPHDSTDLGVMDILAAAAHAISIGEACKPLLGSLRKVNHEGYGCSRYRKSVQGPRPCAEMNELVLNRLWIAHPICEVRCAAGSERLAIRKQTAHLKGSVTNIGALATLERSRGMSQFKLVDALG